MTRPPPPTAQQQHPHGKGMHTHPRRPPANKSVSLLHSPPSRQQRAVQRESDTSSNDSNQAQMRTTTLGRKDSDSPSSLNPLGGKHSSGESSNAEKWFEKSNNHVHEASKSYTDNDPPFFLRNSSSSEEQADGQMSVQPYLSEQNGSLPMRTGLLHLGTDGSSTEDYRGVIDDLTIENKKLKRRLKRYEKLHDSHLKDEKLFEVRIHGLPADKKRELEETLRKFATDLHGNRNAEFLANGYVGLGALLQTQKTASSSTSLQNTDSAYASMSASGQGSSTSDTRTRPFAQSAKSRHQNIHTYLHHIPEGLLPNSNPEIMTERAKKKLVVRRLEQIFAGKGAAAGGHQQALQQQDVSHMAARAERKAREADGDHSAQEGVREANIMHKTNEELAKEANLTSQQATKDNAKPSSDSSLEQRPTRPLDLDPHRAQIPADNLRYFRHLGFTLPEADGGYPEDDQGWVYLNLLINMAQLHTINVTSDFVRKAISEHSAKLEMSSDGRKIRWKGGRSVTRGSSHGGDSIIERTDDDDSSQSPRKRVRLSTMDNDRDHVRVAQKQGIAMSARSQDNSRFAYTPLFFHKDSTGDEESSSEMDDDDAMSSPFPQPIGGDSSGMTSSGIRTTSTKNKPKHDDGPIIFYNNARFCTDLSGDRKPTHEQRDLSYIPYSAAPIGMPSKTTEARYYEKRGPLAEAMDLPEPMDLVDNPIPESQELAFPSSSPAESHANPEASPINFEVTGIGGVYPADNFSIAVQSRQAVGTDQNTTIRSKVLPSRIARILHGKDSTGDARPTRHEQIISARRKELQPSALPPALSYMQNDSLSDDGSDDEDNMSISPESPGIMPRLAAPQPIDLPFSMIDESDGGMDYDEDDNDDESDDGSLDLLAVARKIDPEAVRAREREYDANMAERLAEEIPAGSSAATAGGGSGFASPASGISKTAYHKARKEARSYRPALPAAQTSGSMALGGTSSMESEAGDKGSVSS
ncbi:hypothetical protein AMS68_001492 [Peltaster fructicola]|uniref:Frequency clock protein n=1 Tax=Peltaster fructicola TaxID=286661 RepID=A0A6H0XMW3_9PEZI|nr:hypothetical protein AMS68_001492 [Peltaster fructicola]